MKLARKLKERRAMSATRASLLVVTLIAAAGLFLGAPDASAQGCVASRIEAPGGVVDPNGVSYFLPKKGWQTSLGFRGFRSHRHFVGSVEQNAENTANGSAERDRKGSEVINHSYLYNLNVSYGINERLSVGMDLPYVYFIRKSPASANAPLGRTESKGLSDITLTGRYWLLKPSTHATGN